MSIFEIKQGLNQTGKMSKPEKASAPIKQEKKGPQPITRKKEIKIQDIKSGILSGKNELYAKYKILGKEADEFAKEITDKKYGSFLDIREGSKLKGDLEKIQRTAPDIKVRIKAGNKLRFLKDKYGI